MSVTAIITAAGQGKRMKSVLPKQFLELLGRPMICHTLERFDSAPSIDSIIVTIEENRIEDFKNEILKWWPIKKLKKVVAGGKERQDSIYAALKVIDWPCDLVAIHDGVRPLVTISDIEEVIKAAQVTGAAILATPMKETIKQTRGSSIEKTVDRSVLWGAKTPQVFKKDLIISAFEKACEDGFLATDDALMVERLGQEVSIVQGDETNIKITTPEDMLIAEAILKRNLCV